MNPARQSRQTRQQRGLTLTRTERITRLARVFGSLATRDITAQVANLFPRRGKRFATCERFFGGAFEFVQENVRSDPLAHEMQSQFRTNEPSMRKPAEGPRGRVA